MDVETFVYRLSFAFLFGAAIGVERQWHQKMAGLRTNVLVSLGAASFVAFSDLASKGVDPTRIAAQVVSGIGFLGAGVIMHQGFSVHGLNTAATLWCSAAIGSLAGAGYLAESAIAAASIVLANSLLRPASDLMNRYLRAPAEGAVCYLVVLRAPEADSTALRSDLLDRAAKAGLSLQELKSAGTGVAGQVEITASLIATRRCDAVLEAIITGLGQRAQVSEAKWQVTGDGMPHG
jgi:putative Mg2+ transporter-C (MgtC) family protein